MEHSELDELAMDFWPPCQLHSPSLSMASVGMQWYWISHCLITVPIPAGRSYAGFRESRMQKYHAEVYASIEHDYLEAEYGAARASLRTM